MAEDAEHAAFLAQPVGVEIERIGWPSRFRHREGAGGGRGGSGDLAVDRARRACRCRRRRACERRRSCGARRRAPAARSSGSSAARVRPRRRARRRPFGAVFDLIQVSSVVAASSGSIAMMRSAVSISTGRVLAFCTHSGCCLSPTSQLKIAKATTASRKPRAAPNTKPSERSSAPILESRIASESRTVNSDTTISVAKNTTAAATACSDHRLVDIGLQDRAARRDRNNRPPPPPPTQEPIASTSRVKPRIIDSSAETKTTPSTPRSR